MTSTESGTHHLEGDAPASLQRWSAGMAGIVETVRQSLVQVRNGQAGAGAGTIWHPEGLILTNAHAVRGRTPDVTLPDGRTLPARLLSLRAELDLAALGVDAKGLPTIHLGDSKQLRPGEWVLALGHPWGVLGSVTAGIITGLGTHLPEMPLPDREWIAMSVHLRPGYSGGPVVDHQGRLVGINTIMAGPNVGLAIPVHVVKAFLHQALN